MYVWDQARSKNGIFGGTSENLREQCLLAEGDLKKKRKKSLVQNAIFSPDFEAISKKRSSHLEDFVICEFWWYTGKKIRVQELKGNLFLGAN